MQQSNAAEKQPTQAERIATARAAAAARGLKIADPITVQKKEATRSSSHSGYPRADRFIPVSMTLPSEITDFLLAKTARSNPSAGEDTPSARAAQTVVFSDGFEGAFPGAWDVFDLDGATNGEVFWDKSTQRVATGSASAWCAGGGANALNEPGPYANNMKSWMIAGPFDLSDAVTASFDHKLWLDSESGFDFFSLMASEDGSGFSGLRGSGSTGDFISQALDLTDVPVLGDLTKPSNTAVWIAFIFESDSLNTLEGCYVDDVSVTKEVGVASTDLKFNSINAIDGVFAEGDTTEIIYDVENVGTLASAIEMTLYISPDADVTSGDTVLDALSLGPINPGARHFFLAAVDPLTTIPALADGTYYIGGILKDDINNANNLAVDPVPITIDSTATSPADLDNGLVVGPGGIWQHGQIFSIANIVGNQGGRSTSSYRQEIRLSGDTAITDADHLLNPSGSGEFFFGLPPGEGVSHEYPIDPIPIDVTDDQYIVGTILELTSPDTDIVSGNDVNFDPFRLKISNSPEMQVTPNSLEFDEPLPEAGSKVARISATGDTKKKASDVQFQALMDRAVKEGRVSVIVGFELATRAEAYLDDISAVQQRGDIRAMGDQLMTNLKGLGVIEERRFAYIPFMTLEVNEHALQSLVNSPLIGTIQENRIYRLDMASSNPVIGSPTAWAEGFNGAGQTVAVIDTGVKKSHPWFTTEPPSVGGPLEASAKGAFVNKVVAEGCFSTTSGIFESTCPLGEDSITGEGSGVNCDLALDGCDHGTHVSGTVAGYDGTGPDFGVAWGANLIAINSFRSSDDDDFCGEPAPCISSNSSDIVAAIEYVYSLRNDHNIAAINLSLGDGMFSDSATCDADNAAEKAAIDMARSAGIATIAATGNDFQGGAAGSPACISTAVSVTATNDADVIADFANVFPGVHLAAPGVSITSAWAGDQQGGTVTWDGTSMATPHIAGAWAVIKGATGGSVDDILADLIATGTLVDDMRFAAGATAELNASRELTPVTDIPRINLDQAINLSPSTFKISNLGGPDLNVSTILSSEEAAWLSLSPKPPFQIPSGDAKVVRVLVNYELAPQGTSVRRLEITSDDPDNTPPLEAVEITVNRSPVGPEFDAMPGSLAFGNVPLGVQSAAQIITVRNLGGADLTLDCSIPGANADDYTLGACATPLASRVSTELSVKCAPQTIGANNATLTITSNDSDELSNSFQLTCNGVFQDLISEDGFEDNP